MEKMKIDDFVLLLAERDTNAKIEIKKCFSNSSKSYVAYVINGQVVKPNQDVMVDKTNISSIITIP